MPPSTNASTISWIGEPGTKNSAPAAPQSIPLEPDPIVTIRPKRAACSGRGRCRRCRRQSQVAHYDGNAKQRVPADQQTVRDDAPQDENDQSAIRQVRRQHRGHGGIHQSEQFRTNSVILRLTASASLRRTVLRPEDACVPAGKTSCCPRGVSFRNIGPIQLINHGLSASGLLEPPMVVMKRCGRQATLTT